MNIGSVTTTKSGTEVVYPLGTADCGVRQFTDCWEIWLEAAVNYEPGHDGPMPRVDGSVFIDSFDESLLSEGELKIRQPELFPDLDDRSQATFTMYSGDPSLIGPCVFRFLKFDGEHVQVHWEGTIDPSLGEESSLSSEFSLEANFRYHGVTDTGLPSSALAIEGSCLFLLVCVATAITGFNILARQLGWPWWAGAVAGWFVGHYFNVAIDSRRQRRIRKALAPKLRS